MYALTGKNKARSVKGEQITYFGKCREEEREKGRGTSPFNLIVANMPRRTVM